jgi:thioredoxin reductase (NADPH)
MKHVQRVFLFLCFMNISFCCSAFAKEISEQVVILGSGPAGLTAAIYTSRAGLSTLLIEGEEPGGQIGLSYMVDNFPGFPQGINGFDLGQNMREQAIRFGARISHGKITSVDLSQRPFVLHLHDGTTVIAEALIIATGASANWLGIPSEQTFIGKGVSSCAVCDGFVYKGKEVVVVGGGNTAVEDALFLAKYASKVTVVHRRNTLKASKYLQDQAFANKKIHFIWNSVVEDIRDPQKGKVSGVAIRNTVTNDTQQYPCQGIFIAIGHSPNTHLFQGQLELDPSNYIVTQPFSTRTSVEGVFAAGDVADPRYRQAITAAGTGCMAGMDVDHFIQQLKMEKL